MTTTMEHTRDVLKNWPFPPPGGWEADDLDRLPSDGPNGELDIFKRVELIDGALILMSPQRLFHESVITGLRHLLDTQAPEEFRVTTQFTVKISKNQRPAPDVLVYNTAAAAPDRTFFQPSEVHLVAEVVSPESDYRDRKVKPRIYAAAGIEHFWIISDESGKPVIATYELDPDTHTYDCTGIYRDSFTRSEPFDLEIHFAELLR
ncbi:Uma2 family endonuclease [Nonomuraea soli]|uniref:Uma2 family endonuclease n=1 Tax=Nonomuraea soli TaxID=1032476 RepID=A0A7W0CTT6_9ACTN|nr:Uma2 family endonuclease [Nonomuraea soli]MBA2897226.1 Uma2 family endonuclease [Nonomuraea soli]